MESLIFSSKNMDLTHLEQLIVIDPEMVWGTPVFRGTRVPIRALVDHLESDKLEEFLDGFPSVTREHAAAVIAEMAKHFLTSLTALSGEQLAGFTADQ